jgi:hypothetical protein
MTRRRNVTEQAATAAIEQGCRMLRLPTIRDRFSEIAAAAEREQMTYLAPNGASATLTSPVQNAWKSSPLTPTHPLTPPPSTR